MVLHSSSELIDPVYQVTELLANTAYLFTVTPFYNSAAEYAQSIQVTTLAVIGELTVDAITETTVSLSWNRLPYAYNDVSITWTDTTLIAQYYSQRTNKNNVYFTGAKTDLLLPSNVITGLTPNHPYFFTITAYNQIRFPTPSIITNTIYTFATVGKISCSRTDTTPNSIKLSWPLESSTKTALYWSSNATASAGGPAAGTHVPITDATDSNIIGSAVNIVDASYLVPDLAPNITYNFALYPYNASNISMPSYTPSRFAWTTIPILNAISITAVTTNSLRLNWTPSPVDNLLVKWINAVTSNVVALPISSAVVSASNYYDITTDIHSNKLYQLRVYPYNVDGYRGATLYSPTFVTLATVGAASVAEVTAISLVLSWGAGSYSTVQIIYKNADNSDNGTLTGITGSSHKFENMVSNILYSFKIIPINSVGVAGTDSEIAVSTLPSITTLSLSTDYDALLPTSVKLTWNTGTPRFSSVNIYWNDGSNMTGIMTSTILIPNLAVNTLYNFTLVPFNHDGFPGVTQKYSVTTMGSVSNITAANITTNSMVLSWSRPQYASLNIVIVPVLPTQPIIGIDNLTTQYVLQNLDADTMYTIQLVTVNNAGTQYISAVNTITATTLPIIQGLSVNNADISINRMTVRWNPDASSYEYITLAWKQQIIVNKVVTEVAINSVNIMRGTNPYYNVTGLMPNQAYKYTATPYNSAPGNASAVAGISMSTPYVYTLSDITTVTIADYTINTLTLAWTSLPNAFDSIAIFWIYNGVIYNKQNIHGNGYILKDVSIAPNNSYTIQIVSYNAAAFALPGTSLTTQTVVTKPTVGTIVIRDIAVDSISILWGNVMYFNYVIINWNTGTPVTGYTANTYTLPDLQSNYTYTITITPYNSIGVVGDTASVTTTTLATIGALSITGKTDTSFNLQWIVGTYTTVNVQWSSSGSAADPAYNGLIIGLTGTTTQITGLKSNIQYTISAFPYNSITLPGAAAIQISTSYATVGGVNITNIMTTSVDVSWASGTYTTVTIEWVQVNPASASGKTAIDIPYLIATLSPNTSYIFSVVPYNSAGEPNIPGTRYSLAIVTQAFISAFAVTAITDSSITVQFDNGAAIGDYSTFDLTWVPTNNSAAAMTALGNTGVAYTIATAAPPATPAIMPNVTYNISALPYNSIGVAWAPSTVSLVATSLATIGVVNVTDIETTTISINWDFANSTYVIITWTAVGGGGGSTVYASPSIYTSTGNNAYVIGASTGNAPLAPNQAYTITVTPYNSQFSPNTAKAVVNTVTTLPSIFADASTATVTETTIQIFWNGQFANVQVNIIDVNNPALNIPSHVVNYPVNYYYNGTDINANTTYQFVLIPYNSAGRAGTEVDVVVTSRPIIINPHIYNVGIGTNQVTMSWTNQSKNYVSIAWSPPDALTTPNPIVPINSYYTAYNLRPNVYYNFTMTPYNIQYPLPPANAIIAPAPGNSIYASALTLPYIQSVNAILTDTTASNIVYGAYSNLRVTWSNMTVANAVTSNTYKSSASNPFIISGLISDSKYLFTYTPYNNSNIVGVAYSNVVVALATIGAVSVNSATITISTLDVSWVSQGFKYDYIYLTWLPADNTGTSGRLYNTNSYQMIGLNPNITYTIVATPVNTFDILNTVGATSTVSCTLPIITANSISVDTIAAYSVVVHWSGIYNGASIYWNVYGSGTISSFAIDTANTTGATASITIPPTGMPDLVANTLYNFSITPYNNFGVAGAQVTISAPIYTLTIINTITSANVTISSVDLSWTSTGTYDVVSVGWAPVTSGQNPKTIKATSTSLTALVANTTYTITVTPYAPVAQGRTLGIAKTAVINTLPTIGGLSYSDLVDTSVKILWRSDIYHYTTVVVSWTPADGAGISDPQTGSSYVASGLHPNTAYIFVVTPYNGAVPPVAGATASIAISTLTVINPNSNISVVISADSATTSKAVTTWSGIYNYVTYYWTWTDYTGHAQSSTVVTINSALSPNTDSTHATGLLPNIQYTFFIQPYNNSGIPGIVKSLTIASLPTLTGAAITGYTDGTATVTWGTGADHYTSVLIQWNATDAGAASTGSIVVAAGTTLYTTPANTLLANRTYSFTVTPINQDGVYGVVQTAASFTTLGTLTTSIVANATNSMNITWYGINSYVIISWNGSGSPSGHLAAAASPYTVANLSPNTAYTITITPYNTANIPPSATIVQANPFGYFTLVTFATVTVNVGGIVTTTNSINIPWTSGSFSYLIITWTPADGTAAGTSPHITYGSAASYTIQNVNAFTVYQVTVTPYNSAGVPPMTVTPISVITKVFISSVTVTAVTVNSVSISWVGNYYSVAVYYSGNATHIAVANGISAFTFDSSNSTLAANSNYTFYVIPYDNATPTANAGTTKSVSAYTSPIINTAAVTPSSIGSRSASVTWTGSFYYVMIYSVLGGVGGIADIGTRVSGNSLAYTTLLPNTVYVFNVAPYNSSVVGFSSGSVVTTAPILTLALIQNFQILSITTNDMLLQWNAATFTTVSITWSGGNVGNVIGYTGTTFSFGGYLIPSSTYTFTLTAYNSAGLANTTEITTATATTLPNLLTFTTTAITYNSIALAWTGYFYSINIQWTGTDGTTGRTPVNYTGSSYTASVLSTNVSYTFQIIPYNNGTPKGVGAQLQIISSTLGTIGAISIVAGSIQTTSATVSWASGIFTYVQFTITGTTNFTDAGHVTASPYTITGLAVNGTYTVTAVPYNSANPAMPGTPQISASFVTLPSVDSFNISDITNTNMILTWSGTYSTLNLTFAGATTGTILALRGNTYNFTNQLTPNSIYTFVLTPYNSAGVVGATYSQTAATLSS